MPFALGIEDQIVLPGRDRVLLPVPGMEVGRILGQRALLDPVDVVVEQVEFLDALVDDFDTDRLAEGHVPETVVGVGVFDDHWQTDDLAAFAETVGEEVAQRRFDAGALPAVVIDA